MKNKDYCKIIAEAGVNHNGKLSEALKLVDIAAGAGADYIKFQTFNSDELATTSSPTASYQQKNNNYKNQLDMLKSLELKEEDYPKIYSYCDKKNIEFLSTPFDINSASNLINLGMKLIKIPSGEITNKPFIESLVKLDKPMILSTGMATLEEVKLTVNWIKETRKRYQIKNPIQEMLTILHCTSSYPAPKNELNLRAMQTLSKEFNLPVGYSDHSLGIEVPTIAVSMGATIIEKHFTLNKEQPGPDHKASLSPLELNKMIKKIRDCEAIMGSPIKQPSNVEEEVKEVARRSVCSTKSIQKGDLISQEIIALKRPGNGIQPKDINLIIGRKLNKNIEKGQTIKWEDLF